MGSPAARARAALLISGAAVGLYTMLAPLVHWPPYREPSEKTRLVLSDESPSPPAPLSEVAQAVRAVQPTPAEINEAVNAPDVGAMEHSQSRPGSTVAEPLASIASKELVVTLDKEEFHPYEYTALIVGVKLTVRNLTDHEQTLGPCRWMAVGPWHLLIPAPHDVGNETYRYERQRPRTPGFISAEDTVSGWWWVAFEHRAEGGRPGYQLTVSDGLGNQYPF